jgi:beta-N-acetylhexosaminidase
MNKNYDRRDHIKPLVFGVEGKTLSRQEVELFSQHNPLGFILFARNIESPEQVKKLTMQLRSTVFPRNDVLILIDQEGGRVSRLNPPHWYKMPPARHFGELVITETLNRARRHVYNQFRMCAYDLRRLGINVNCAPLLDLLFEGADDIIGDRSFSSDHFEVSELGKEVCRGLLMDNVFPMIKHIPGHGRANCDSHKELPVVDASIHDLRNKDFMPFAELKDMPFAMTAHIVYNAIDKENPATLSKKVIEEIRKTIGFQGLLFTDDLTMKALSGSMAELGKKALDAGCDVLLHCSGNFDEMKELAESTDYWNSKDRERYRDCWKVLRY